MRARITPNTDTFHAVLRSIVVKSNFTDYFLNTTIQDKFDFF